MVVSGSLIVTAGITGSISSAASASYAATSSYANNFTVASTLTAQTLVVQIVTSSILYSSGSNVFGNSLANTQVFTGSVSVTGSLALAGNITSNGTAVVLGSGTTNYLPKFTGTSAIGNSNLINNASGNLGLGVTPSAWFTVFSALQLGGNFSGTAFAGALVAQTNDNKIGLYNNSYVNSSVVDTYYATAEAAKYIINRNAHEWYNAPTGTAGNAITFTQAMTLFSDGNLGLGTSTNAGYKLDVNGTGRFSDNLIVGNGTSTATFIINRGTTTNGNPIRFQTAGTNNWYIGSGATSINTNLEFYNHSTATSNLTLNYSTGAATFSSNVKTNTLFGFSAYTTDTDDFGIWATTGTSGGTTIGSAGNTTIRLRTNNVDRLSINGSGAATFSSSVTAGAGVYGTEFYNTSGYPYNTLFGSGADATTTTIRAGSTNGYATYIVLSGQNGASPTQSILFNTSSAERMRTFSATTFV